MRSFAHMAAGDVCPMQAVIGGITAQEVMKVSDYVHEGQGNFACM